MGYTPSQLLTGFNPFGRVDMGSESNLDELESYVQKVLEGIHPLPSASNSELRVAALDEV